MLLGLITCREALAQLQDYVDRELSPEETDRVAKHLKLCAACARKFRSEEGLIRELRERLDHLVLPPDLMALISRRLSEELHESPS